LGTIAAGTRKLMGLDAHKIVTKIAMEVSDAGRAAPAMSGNRVYLVETNKREQRNSRERSKIPKNGSNMHKSGSNKNGPNMLRNGPNMPRNGSNMPKDGSNMPKDGSNMPKDGSNMPKDGPKAPKNGLIIAKNRQRRESPDGILSYQMS
jgi:hypothetical protein